MMARRIARAVALLALLAVPAGTLRADIPYWDYDTPSKCDDLVRQEPHDIQATQCYRLLARGNDRYKEVSRHLDSLRLADPKDAYLLYALGCVEADERTDRAEPLLKEAAAGFDAVRDPKARTSALVDLYFSLRSQGRLGEAQETLEQAHAAAESADLYSRLLVRYHEGIQASDEGQHDKSRAIYEEVRAALPQVDSRYLEGMVTNGLAEQASYAGRWREAYDWAMESARIQKLRHDSYFESLVLTNAGNFAARLVPSGQLDHSVVISLFRAASEAASRSGSAEAKALRLLSDGNDLSRKVSERISLLSESRTLAHRAGNFGVEVFALRALARATVEVDPAALPKALDMVDEAIRQSQQRSDATEAGRGYLVRMSLLKAAGRKDEAFAAWRKALDVVEEAQSTTPGRSARSGLMGLWSYTYYQLSAELMKEGGAAPSPETIEDAFGIMERQRSRRIIDQMLTSAAAARVGTLTADREKREKLLETIAGLQTRLLSPHLQPGERRALLEDLRVKESEESALMEKISLDDPAYGRLMKPRLVSISEIQAALGQDEALLSFQIAPGNLQGWLFVFTRNQVRAYPAPSRSHLGDAIALTLGLLERRDGSEAAPSTALYEELLATPLRDLPPEITRLVIVPDAMLDQLPFEVLRPAPADPPLGLRYQITRAPSATRWHEWRTSPPGGAEMGALCLADPELKSAGPEAGTWRAATLDTGLQLGRLPRARDEAGAIVDAMGSGRVLVAARASERLVKEARLGDYRLVHFATHAIVDEIRPDRSAILLAPGDPAEDGLLQIREIVGLPLSNTIVILSACRSASGAIPEGEAVTGLAQAFFEAGARAVVGSFWPLRDDESDALVERFADHLGRGASLAEAMRLARGDLIARGAPAASWAGLLVIGDGDLVPRPGGAPSTIGSFLLRIILPTIAVIGLLFYLLRRRRRARHA